MPHVRIASSPLHPGGAPLDLYYQDVGASAASRDDGGVPPAPPLLILHGGWGYGFYPFDAALAALTGERRCVIPDRTGYGRSPRVTAFPPRFHEAAAAEAEAVLEAVGIERCAIWGHSDGAVIAAWMAVRQPARYAAVILEALHVDRAKPRSRGFFTQMAEDPDSFGDRVTAKLAAEHGADWRTVLRADGRVWLDLAAAPELDTLDGRWPELRAPVLLLHGSEDPRTEPGELERVRRAVPQAELAMIAGAGHSPHSERAAAAEATVIATRFLRAHT
ncbi:MAG: alpha/beta hydrolase [Deltaproteobacteria bacterium]|nr:alpha/beta hydrolase [Deltaproteobacteria bacterium]